MTLRNTRNGLPETTRLAAVQELLPCLASTADLYLQAKTAHWNLRGPRFLTLHELFDKIAEALIDPLDDLAERIVQLGGLASSATAQSLSSKTTLSPISGDSKDEAYYLGQIATALATLASAVRTRIDSTAALGDAVTADLLTGFGATLDKLLWFVEAHSS